MSSRAHIHLPQHLGDRAADFVTTFAGSWTFLGLHVAWFAYWIVFAVEPYPFGLLTMIVSLEAIVLSTLVMLSQNRSATRDHKRDDVEAEEVELLFEINKRQLEILEALHKGTT